MNITEINGLLTSLPEDLSSYHGIPELPPTMTTAHAQKLYQQLEMETPFVQFSQESISVSPEDQATIQLHAHPFFELIYCREPSGVEYLIGHSIYKPEAGDVIFVPPGVSHRLLLPERPPSSYTWDVLWISRKFMEGMFSPLPQEFFDSLQNAPIFRSENGYSFEIGNIFHYGILEAANHAPGWINAMAGGALLLLSHLLRLDRAEVLPAQADRTDLIDQILAYIETNLSEKISVSQVAKLFYVSESTVSQTFRKKMGISFYRCLTQRRLVLARALIADGLPMDNVAQQAGFSDYSAFYRAFKREFGISPREYHNKVLRSRK